jgi:hypothetical protein
MISIAPPFHFLELTVRIVSGAYTAGQRLASRCAEYREAAKVEAYSNG